MGSAPRRRTMRPTLSMLSAISAQTDTGNGRNLGEQAVPERISMLVINAGNAHFAPFFFRTSVLCTRTLEFFILFIL